jgi:hypothetical protein
LVVGGGMRHARSLLAETALSFAFLLFFSLMAAGQQAATVPARITQPVNMENLVALRGNTHPLARPEYDQGAAPDSLPTERMLLVLQRSAEQEAALRNLLDEQQIKSSPNFHMWLTPEQFGQQFGPADADIQAVTDWLTSQGFQVNHVATGRTVIEFSGTAGQVRKAFQTEIHKFVVKGEEYWANASDPQIPAALAPVVAGFASLNNFPRKPSHRVLGAFSKSKATGQVTPLFTYTDTTGTWYAVGPTDFATIYNVSPLWTAGTDGTGQTIAISQQSDIDPQDVADFRTMFGLPTTGNYFTTINNGPDPGIVSYTGDETEADLDVQWAGAVAKGATIDLVVSEGTEVTYGIDLSALYIIDNNLAPIMSESYNGCEAFLGNSSIAFYNTLWEQGAAQGITILISAGDSGSAGCDAGETAAMDGAEINGIASTPFNVVVGGTDFNDASNASTYWSATNNSTTQSSAKSYIPETTWNDSCANTGNLAGCASGVASDGSDLAAGGGGPSNCANSTWVPTSSGIEINCNAGIPKPPWQTGPGVPSDGVRDIPDVSLFASNGYHGSFYVICETDYTSQAGGSASSCDLSQPYQDFLGLGGTSAATPAFAGIMALVNQKYGRQGNANYVLYPMAAPTGASCPSTSLMAPNANTSSCIFYDVQVGNNSVACVMGYLDCNNAGTGEYGILVNPSNTSLPAWLTTAGYDVATGLGSVNAYNLVQKWTSNFTTTQTTLCMGAPCTTSPITITHGSPVNFTVNVSPASASGDVSLVAPVGSSPSNSTGIGPFTLSGGSVSNSTNMLPGGTYGVTAHYAGNGTDGLSNSNPVTVTVNPETSNTLVQLVEYTPDCLFNVMYGVTSVTYGQVLNCSGALYLGYWLRVDVTSSSGSLNTSYYGGVAGACFNNSSSNPTGLPTYPCPTGQVTVTAKNGQPPPDLGEPSGTTPGTYTLNSQGNAEDQFIQLPGGTYTLSASYAPSPAPPNNSYRSSTGTSAAVTVTQAGTGIAVTASPTTVTSGQSVTLTATVSTSSVGFAPTGAVQFLNSGAPISGTVTYTPVNASDSGNASLCLAPLAPYTICASLTATLTTSFTTTATITAQYLGGSDPNYAASPISAPVTVTVTGAGDFNLPASPPPITITAPGQPGTSTIAVSFINGFTGTVNFTCAIPAAMTGGGCSMNPTSLTASGNTTLTVTTTGTTLVAPRAPELRVPPSFRLRLGLPWLLLGLLALAMLMGLIAARRPARLAFATTLLVVGIWLACGGGGGGGGTGPPPAPGVGLSPTSLTFASQNVGTTSAAQVVTLSNTGNATLSITSIAISGTNSGDFAPTTACGSSLAAGANCAINVTFKPTATGTRSASLAVTDNASGSPHTVSLSGTGTSPTPPDTYTVTVTGTSGSLSHPTTVQVTVQ